MLELDGLRRRYRVVRAGARWFVQVNGRAVALVEQPRFPDLESAVPEGGCVAPMPGKVVTVDVEVGQSVEVDMEAPLLRERNLGYRGGGALAHLVSTTALEGAQLR